MKEAKRHVATYSGLRKGRFEYQMDVQSAASQLLDAIQSVGKPSKPTDVHILMYFDEAHPLYNVLLPLFPRWTSFSFLAL